MSRWEIVKLGDVYEITSSKRVFQSEWTDQGVPFYRAREIAKLAVDGFVDNELFISEKMFEDYTNRYGKPGSGDIMVTGVGTLGVCYVVKDTDKFYFKDGNIIWLKQKSNINSNYVKWTFKSNMVKEQISRNSSGTTVGTYTIVKAKETIIPLPPLETQKQIANTLDTAAELLGMRRQQLAELDNLIKSTFYDMFGDPVKNEMRWAKESLRSLSIKFSDGPFGSNLKTCHYEEYGIRVIRLNNIGVNEFLDDNKAFISKKHYNDVLKKYTCYPGDVVIGTMGEPNVRACVVPEFIKLSVNKADCILCRPNKDKVSSEYLCGVINSPYFFSLVSNLFHGQTRTRVSMGQLANLEIIVPPLPLQNQYVQTVSKIDEQKALVKKAIDETQYLFDSLMSEYFD